MAIKSESEAERKAKQAAYHDWEATTYDEKFAISYDERCIEYVRARFDKVIDEPVEGRVLEVGAGTGFFLVNLALSGAIDGELHATDISEGMLSVCKRNAEEHGLVVETRQGDAEALPYDDATFDLVIGHAFIHHLPVPGKALQEMFRVLRPGGQVLIAGEPTEIGDRISQVIKRSTYRAFRAVTSLPVLRGYRKPTLEEMDDDEEATLAGLEHEVDLHTFRPKDVEHMARLAGFDDVEVVTEELTANWVGWAVRTIEGSVQPDVLGYRWYFTAFNAYRWLTRLDEQVLARFVPRNLFYNLILHGRKPVSG
ncbi:MAG: methyltransferase domain-containing protein [Nitriliruptorales bacterium]|nr:methyltransferase domain-containing protein [Nitriliruptorales bacterium]